MQDHKLSYFVNKYENVRIVTCKGKKISQQPLNQG